MHVFMRAWWPSMHGWTGECMHALDRTRRVIQVQRRLPVCSGRLSLHSGTMNAQLSLFAMYLGCMHACVRISF